MAKQSSKESKRIPLILRCNRLIEAFAKSDDERDFYLDRTEGFLIYIDLDRSQEEIENLERELVTNNERYCLIPKLTFYEAKKIMESFVNEKVYDIDTKEKLLEIIQSKEARENFLEFVCDQHAELEKWQQFYQERSRIRIIEWLRKNNFHFVFEEDLDLPRESTEKLKEQMFVAKVDKEQETLRKQLDQKAKSYYSSEALNPRPKRGRPPKQTQKVEIQVHLSRDVTLTIPGAVRPFLFTPDITTASSTSFSSKFSSEESLEKKKGSSNIKSQELTLASIQSKLDSLRKLTSQLQIKGETKKSNRD